MFKRLDSRFDVLTQVLEAVHLGGALSSCIELRAPWGLHFGATEHRAGFHLVLEGRCWVTLHETGEPIALEAGDMVVFPHGAGHRLGDHWSTPALSFQDDVADLPPGGEIELRTGGEGAAARVLCGSYAFSVDGANPLLRGLPDMLHVPAVPERHPELSAAIGLLAAEARHAGTGTALVVDRLVDLLFVYALRAWFADVGEARLTSWFGALQDPVVGPSILAMHDRPAHDWTVAALARESGLSRAAFARRFQRAVGEPPLNYLTRWRMTLAADLLRQGERVAAVAHRVGYRNEFAFAKAFKRLRGMPPGLHRRRFASGTDAPLPQVP